MSNKLVKHQESKELLSGKQKEAGERDSQL